MRQFVRTTGACLVAGFLLVGVGCNTDGPQDDESCADEGTFGYDSEQTVCVERGCPRDESLDGAYETKNACREAEFDDLGQPDAADGGGDGGLDASDVGDEPDASDGESTDSDVEDGPEDGTSDSSGEGDASNDIVEDTSDVDDGSEDVTDTDPMDAGDGTETADTADATETQDAADTTETQDVADTTDTTDTADTEDTSGDTQSSCQDDYGTTSCFSNYDCSSDERCETVETQPDPLSCCTTGDRGTKPAGDTCTQERRLACESGVCLTKSGSSEYYCSKECQGDDDCPNTGVEECESVIGWCVPK